MKEASLNHQIFASPPEKWWKLISTSTFEIRKSHLLSGLGGIARGAGVAAARVPCLWGRIDNVKQGLVQNYRNFIPNS